MHGIYNGVISKTLGNKLQSSNFLSMINGPDFIFLTETWKSTDAEVTGYRSIISDAIVSKNCGRNSGGIFLLYKNIFHDCIVKTSSNFLCFIINKRYTKAMKDIYVCVLFIPLSSSKYFDPELFNQSTLLKEGNGKQ